MLKKKYGYLVHLKDKATIEFSPHDAITGNSGCLAIDRMLPLHLPTKHPNNLPGKSDILF